jgi:hypothetical protein
MSPDTDTRLQIGWASSHFFKILGDKIVREYGVFDTILFKSYLFSYFKKIIIQFPTIKCFFLRKHLALKEKKFARQRAG